MVKTVSKKASPSPTKLKQELFCRYYTQNEELFGNATHSYAEAFGYNLDGLSHDDAVYENYIDEEGKESRRCVEASSYDRAYNVCSVTGNRLLRKAKVQARITVLLNELLEDKIVDSQLAKVIMQNKELPAKIAGIREYNKLKQRIVDKADITSDGLPLDIINEEQFLKIAKRALTKAGGRRPQSGS